MPAAVACRFPVTTAMDDLRDWNNALQADIHPRRVIQMKAKMIVSIAALALFSLSALAGDKEEKEKTKIRGAATQTLQDLSTSCNPEPRQPSKSRPVMPSSRTSGPIFWW